MLNLGGIMEKELPYKNRDLADLPEEEWRLCDDMEYYAVSNLGRAKSLDHITITSDGRRLPITGRVLSQGKIKHKTKDGIEQFSLFIHVAPYPGGRLRTWGVGRLVHTAFKGRIPSDMMLHYINLNSFDNRLENITCISRSQKFRIEYHAGRRTAHTEHLIPWQEKNKTPKGSGKMPAKVLAGKKRWEENGRKQSPHVNAIPVTVYIRKKKFIGSYVSVRSASEQLGISQTDIRNGLQGRSIEVQAKYGIYNMEEFNPMKRKKPVGYDAQKRNKAIVKMLNEGVHKKEVAKKFGLSTGRVLQIKQKAEAGGGGCLIGADEG